MAGGTNGSVPDDVTAFGPQRRVGTRQEPEDQARYARGRDWIAYALHELPAGVLGGADGATPAQCAEMLAGLDEFADVCERLGLDDHTEFIEVCRWHFDHYPHFLGRRRHFVDYATYVRDRHGTARAELPPAPNWLHHG